MLLLVIVALEVPLVFELRDRVNSEIRSEARAQADVVAAGGVHVLARARRLELERLAIGVAAKVRGRVLIVDRAGRLLADSAGSERLGLSFRQRPEIASALAGKAVQGTRHSRTLNSEILYTAVPILRGRLTVGAVRVTQSVAAVNRATRRATLGLALAGAIVLALGLLVAMILAAQIARPVKRLDAAVRRVADGDLSARAHVEGTTEQRSLARTFNQMTERIDRLLRIQRDFVANASHQLRTPLTGVRLRIEEAAAQSSDGAVLTELELATREVDRLAEIVDELLVLSRAGERELPGERVSLTGAAARAVERWSSTAAERDQRIVAAPPVGAAVAWCARQDLDRALDVLIENALGYAPPGTSVALEVRPGSVAVLDRGPGLAPGEEEAVFERFHRGSAGRRGMPGTGLGLAIASELAREWGGSVTLANRFDGGARAVLTLPLPSERRRAAARGRLTVDRRSG